MKISKKLYDDMIKAEEAFNTAKNKLYSALDALGVFSDYFSYDNISCDGTILEAGYDEDGNYIEVELI
jgi:hypothetical protein